MKDRYILLNNKDEAQEGDQIWTNNHVWQASGEYWIDASMTELHIHADRGLPIRRKLSKYLADLGCTIMEVEKTCKD